MEHTVKKAFSDRETGHLYAEGDTYTGADARVAELQKSGHLAATKAAADNAKSDKK